MQYKLSYQVYSGIKDADGNTGGGTESHTTEVISNTHLELAESILNMERDCGAICYGVKIETGSFDNSRAKNQKQVIQHMARWCELLPDAVHIRDLK